MAFGIDTSLTRTVGMPSRVGSAFKPNRIPSNPNINNSVGGSGLFNYLGLGKVGDFLENNPNAPKYLELGIGGLMHWLNHREAKKQNAMQNQLAAFAQKFNILDTQRKWQQALRQHNHLASQIQRSVMLGIDNTKFTDAEIGRLGAEAGAQFGIGYDAEQQSRALDQFRAQAGIRNTPYNRPYAVEGIDTTADMEKELLGEDSSFMRTLNAIAKNGRV